MGRRRAATGPYTFALPQSFDFNGTWAVYRDGSEDLLFRFTIQDNALISITCGSSNPICVPCSAPPSIANGEFSFTGTIGSLSGRIVATGQATGTVDVPGVRVRGMGRREVGDSKSMAKSLVTFICLALVVVVSACGSTPPVPSPATLSVSRMIPNTGSTFGSVSSVVGTRLRRRRRLLVRIDGAVADAVVVNPTVIRVTVPAHPSGPVNVTVTDLLGRHGRVIPGLQLMPPWR